MGGLVNGIFISYCCILDQKLKHPLAICQRYPVVICEGGITHALDKIPQATMACDTPKERTQSVLPSYSVRICKQNEETTKSELPSASPPSKLCILGLFFPRVYFYAPDLHNLDLVSVSALFYLLVYNFMGLWFAVIFSYLDTEIVYVIVFFLLGLVLISVCYKIGDNHLQQILHIRRLFRLVLGLASHETDHLWSFSFSLSIFIFGGISPTAMRIPTSTIQVAEIESETRTTPTHEMESMTDTIRLRSASTLVTIASKPRQPDSFRFIHLKTDSDYRCYLRHLGYYCYLRHLGYCLATVTATWVIVTLIVLDNLNLKNSSSCYLHVLRNIGLDLIQSSPCALIYTGFVIKISLARDVWFSENVGSYEGIDLIGKNWWSYYNLYEFLIILKNLCKVSDFLNRLY